MEREHECLICHQFRGQRSSLWNHVEKEHEISKDEYMWRFVYNHEGLPLCQICGKPLVYDRWNRDIHFHQSCIKVCPTLAGIKRTKKNEMDTPESKEEKLEKRKRNISKGLKEWWKLHPESKQSASERLKKNWHTLNFQINLMLSRGIDLDKPAKVYMISLDENLLKIGFSTNLVARLSWMNNRKIKIIRLLTFKNGYSALSFEFNFHSKYKEFSINDPKIPDSTEIYPINMKKDFIEYFENEYNKIKES